MLLTLAIGAALPALSQHSVRHRPAHPILTNIYSHAGSPTCREDFQPSVGALQTGQSYLCEGTALRCESTFQLTVINKSGGQARSYDCTRANPQQDVDSFICGSQFEVSQEPGQRPGCIGHYTCTRKLEDSRTTACGGGWTPTDEDYTQRIRGGGSDNPVFDLQPTHLFYSCTAPDLPPPSPIH